MEQKLGIIADDFTGANDTGIQLSKKGYSTQVLVDLPQERIETQAQVTIIDTDTRAISSKDAYGVVKQTVSFLSDNQINQLYKKVDSTLRGQIGAEISALEDAWKPDIIVIAPAYPSLKRVTSGGIHYVDGEPVAETEFGRDPKTPVKDSRIVELLKPYGNERLTSFTKSDGVESVQSKLNQGHSWFVCDVETDEDLQTISGVFSAFDSKVLWVGSAGLIEYIDFELDGEGEVAEYKNFDSAANVLTVSGSLSQKTKTQLHELLKLDSVQNIEINPVDLLDGSVLSNFDYDQLSAGNDFILYVDSNEKNLEMTNQYREKHGLTKEQVGNSISHGLAVIANEIIEKFSLNHMILTGGDTAKAVCGELGVSVLELIKEIETGIPLGRAQVDGTDTWIVTKAGGFGDEQSLVHVTNFLKGMKQRDE
ncbi:four-carbon acid sugar kinase family protein [Piscibacillus sp. B03]|uniref:four-carbon acid sugar kinase family protein n=1 Tax=Piscibacillus sp. B03 TaxID=3457430 RepID=UPI003FCDBFA6